MKKHLIGGILTTICGKQLEEVKWTNKPEAANCERCLSLKHETYPKKVKKSES